MSKYLTLFFNNLRNLGFFCVYCQRFPFLGECRCHHHRARLFSKNLLQSVWKEHNGLWLPGGYAY